MGLATVVMARTDILRWHWTRNRALYLFPWIFWLPQRSRTRSAGVMPRPRTVFGKDGRRKRGKRHRILRSLSIRFVILPRSASSIVAKGITSEASLATAPILLRSLLDLLHLGRRVWHNWETLPGTAHRNGMARTTRTSMAGTPVGGRATIRPRQPCCLTPSINPRMLPSDQVHPCARKTLTKG